MSKDEYHYEIRNCFEDAVVLTKTEQQAKSIVGALQGYYNARFYYENIDVQSGRQKNHEVITA